ncbi:MAG: cytochrome P450 [Anaerolineae bacterium]
MFAEKFDLYSDAFFANPHPTYHQLRAEAPVYWCERWGAWVLTRYADVMTVLRQPERFSSAGRVHHLLRQLPEATLNQLDVLSHHYTIGLAHSDPPDHTRLRTLLNKVFMPRMVEARKARVVEIVNERLDAAQAAGEMDIVHDLAYPLPATIIAEMIGAPTEDIGLFREWAVAINNLFALGGRVDAAAAHAAQNSVLDMRDYIAGLVEVRKQQPLEDVLGLLVRAEEQLTLAELVSTAVTFFVAGHETTTNLISNGLLALLQHPDQLALLRENPALMPGAVEEMLRYEPSVPRSWRIAKEEVELGGQVIPQGALIFPMLAAANRDPAVFPDPDRFDLQRENNKHVAFGYGIHFCLGAPLARMEVSTALEIVLRRLPNLHLTNTPLSYKRDVAIRSLNSLPVQF